MTISDHGPLPDAHTADLPDWMAGWSPRPPISTRRSSAGSARSPTERRREAAVLMLFGSGPNGPDVLLLRRADSLGSHPGQVAFPGGGAEPATPTWSRPRCAKPRRRSASNARGVRPLALLPKAYVPVSGFDVTPVLAYWDEPSSVRVVDEGETAAVARVPVAHLVDPANRLQVRHPSGYVSPAYLAPGMLVWGFTAGLLTVLLSIGGWDRPWDADEHRGSGRRVGTCPRNGYQS